MAFGFLEHFVTTLTRAQTRRVAVAPPLSFRSHGRPIRFWRPKESSSHLQRRKDFLIEPTESEAASIIHRCAVCVPVIPPPLPLVESAVSIKCRCSTLPEDDGGDAGRGGRLPRVHLGRHLLPVGQPGECSFGGKVVFYWGF